jgi:hypothetical protein
MIKLNKIREAEHVAWLRKTCIESLNKEAWKKETTGKTLWNTWADNIKMDPK